MNAGWAVSRMRELAQMFADTHEDFRDGFTADAAQVTKTPILPSLNEYIAELAYLRYRFKTNTITIVNGTQAYDYWAQGWTDFYEIDSVYHNNLPLTPTTRESLQAREPGFLATAAGTPEEYFIEGQEIWLWPKPNAAAVTADTTLDVRCVSTHPILDDAVDEILYIPHALQLILPHGATCNLLSIEVDNPEHQKRYPHLTQKAQIFEQRMAALNFPEQKAQRVSLDRKSHAGIRPKFSAPIGAELIGRAGGTQ